MSSNVHVPIGGGLKSTISISSPVKRPNTDERSDKNGKLIPKLDPLHLNFLAVHLALDSLLLQEVQLPSHVGLVKKVVHPEANLL